jgi:hypothetical protein
MSLLPAYAIQGGSHGFNFPALPSGIANNLTWVSAADGTYTASISNISMNINSGSALSCIVSVPATNLADGMSAWLVSSIPSSLSGGSITFYVASQPSAPTNFPISWAITQF